MRLRRRRVDDTRAERQQQDTNESVAVVPVFGVDPRGAALFAGATAGGRVGGGRVPIDPNDTPWHGWTKPPQNFRGASGLGAARPLTPPPLTLEQGAPAAQLSPAQQILEQRAASGRLS